MANTIPSQVIKLLAPSVSKVARETAGPLAVVQKDVQNLPAGVGETVTVGMTSRLTTDTVTPAATPTLPSVVSLKYVQVSLASHKKAEFYLTARDILKIQSEQWIPNQLDEAIRVVMADIKSDVYTALRDCNGYVKTSQTSIFNSTDNVNNIVDARKVLSKQLCPDGNRVLVLSTDEEANALKLSQFLAQYQAGDTRAFRDGFMGRVLGFATYVDNATVLPIVATAGTGADWAITGAHAAGASTLTINSGTGTMLDGDIITIGNYSYRVKTALTGSTVVINEPGLNAAASHGDAVAVVATRDVQALAFDPAAIMLVMRSPKVEGELGVSQIITDPVSGLMFKLSAIPNYNAVTYEVSALWGAGIVDPNKGCEICSA